MPDIFLREDLAKLLRDKHVVFIGDSNTRAIYKDFMCLSLNSTLISDKTLKQKMEPSVFGDKLVYHRGKNAGRAYKEEREYSSKDCKFSFYFITKVFDNYVQDTLQSITRSKGKPDVLVMNSCMWDVTRWGPNGVDEYRKNLVALMKELQKILPSNCLVIWLTTLPLAVEIRGGFLVQQLEFLKYSLRFHIMEANFFARQIVVNHGYDVLDLHYFFKFQVHRRCGDGIHWSPVAVRFMSNLLLQHISLAWDTPLPHRIKASITSNEIYDENKNVFSNFTDTSVFKKDSEAATPLQAEISPGHQETKAKRKKKAKNKRKFQCTRYRETEKPKPFLLPLPSAYPNYEPENISIFSKPPVNSAAWFDVPLPFEPFVFRAQNYEHLRDFASNNILATHANYPNNFIHNRPLDFEVQRQLGFQVQSPFGFTQHRPQDFALQMPLGFQPQGQSGFAAQMPLGFQQQNYQYNQDFAQDDFH